MAGSKRASRRTASSLPKKQTAKKAKKSNNNRRTAQDFTQFVNDVPVSFRLQVVTGRSKNGPPPFQKGNWFMGTEGGKLIEDYTSSYLEMDHLISAASDHIRDRTQSSDGKYLKPHDIKELGTPFFIRRTTCHTLEETEDTIESYGVDSDSDLGYILNSLAFRIKNTEPPKEVIGLIVDIAITCKKTTIAEVRAEAAKLVAPPTNEDDNVNESPSARPKGKGPPVEEKDVCLEFNLVGPVYTAKKKHPEDPDMYVIKEHTLATKEPVRIRPDNKERIKLIDVKLFIMQHLIDTHSKLYWKMIDATAINNKTNSGSPGSILTGYSRDPTLTCDQHISFEYIRLDSKSEEEYSMTQLVKYNRNSPTMGEMIQKAYRKDRTPGSMHSGVFSGMPEKQLQKLANKECDMMFELPVLGKLIRSDIGAMTVFEVMTAIGDSAPRPLPIKISFMEPKKMAAETSDFMDLF